MMKKKMICLVLLLCAALVLTACGSQQETYPNQPRQNEQPQQAPVQEYSVPDQQQVAFYDPTSEEGGDSEPVYSGVTPAPLMQSEYAGATPVRIDPVDKPTPSPLPSLTFAYTTYEAPNLRLTFEGPSGWMADSSLADTYTLSYPNPAMDYEAKAILRAVPVGKDYTQKELIAEVKAQADAVRSAGSFRTFEPSGTAARFFIDGNGVYIAYKGYLNDYQETGVAGRIIVNTVNKTLYILHVSYPRGLADTFADQVYNKIRHSMKFSN